MTAFELPNWLWAALGFFCAVGVLTVIAGIFLVIVCRIDAPEVEGPES